MAQVEFTIGCEVTCTDGPCGKLARVVVDPISTSLTHLVVAPPLGLARLVPLALVAASADHRVELRCSDSGFQALEEAEDTTFLPGAAGQWRYSQEEMLSWPFYGLPMGGMPSTVGVLAGGAPGAITYDKVPIGEVDVRRGQHVHATDGNIGRVQGLVIDPADGHVTHILLQQGHLWGRKRVAIPISAVASVADGVQLKLDKNGVHDLPALDIEDGEAEEADGG